MVEHSLMPGGLVARFALAAALLHAAPAGAGRLVIRLLICCTLISASARAQEQRRLAVLEFDVAAGLNIDRLVFSDLARTAVNERAPSLFVMTRESTDALLQANGRKLADCTGECEVEIGRKLGADFVISGRIAKVGSYLFLTVRLFNEADGRLMTSADARGKDVDELINKTDAVLARLVAPLADLAPASASPPPAGAVASRPRPSAPAAGPRFVEIPAGTFQYQGTRQVSVQAFRLSDTDVTVAAYARCVALGQCKEPRVDTYCNWKRKGRDDHPINCVTWEQANAYCKWFSARLPSEQEWEYVATAGDEAREYPWGSLSPGTRACWNGDGSELGGNRNGTCPVGSHPAGDSKWGVHDMAGNVWQWTSSDYDSDTKAVRGGSWFVDYPVGLRGRYRTRPDPAWSDSTGFRCAR